MIWHLDLSGVFLRNVLHSTIHEDLLFHAISDAQEGIIKKLEQIGLNDTEELYKKVGKRNPSLREDVGKKSEYMHDELESNLK